MALSDRMGLLPLGWQTVRLVTEYSAGKKRLLTPASPFQLTSMSNWKEYTQQPTTTRAAAADEFPFKPVCQQTLKNRRSGGFFVFWAEFGADEAAFVCLPAEL